MKVKLLANAGLLINISGVNLLFDGLHSVKAEPFSAVPQELLNSIIAGDGDFKHIDALIFTHTHKDHFDKRCAELFLKNHAETLFICPALENHPQDFYEYKIKDITIEAKRLPHQGEQYARVLNYGFFIYDKYQSIFISGDSSLDEEPIAEFLGDRKPTAAALCFPFLTLSKGRNITKNINPKTLIAYHLPFEEDDDNRYIESCRRVIKKEDLPYRTEILCRSGEQIII